MKRRSFLVLIAALAMTIAGLAAGPVGAQEAPDIVGGTQADDGEYPFMVAMVSNGGSGIQCGGSLVRPNWVLTADHCVAGKSPGSIDLLVGTWNLADPSSGTRFDAVNFVRHPSADVALIELSGSASTLAVSLAQPSDAGLYPPGEDATVIGWGFTQETPPGTPDLPEKLREIDLPIVSDDDCAAAWVGLVFDLEICAGGEQDRDACNGDSGSPMLAPDGNDWLQIGVVSGGTSYPNCGTLGFPGVYAQVDTIESWVVDNAGPPPAPPVPKCNGLDATVVGTDDPETLTGTNGNDVIVAGAGDDVINALGGRDVICAGEGNDVVNAGAGHDLLIGGPGDDALNGGPGRDTASFAGSAGPVTVDLGTGTASGEGADTLSKVWHLIGSDFDDSLIGNAGMNDLWGGDGDDYLHGKAKDDRMYGGAGDDILNGRGGDDLVDGGIGTDRATYLQSPSGVTIDLSTGSASGGHGNDVLRSIEDLRGSNHGDSLTGNAKSNHIWGARGDDQLFGRAGNDELRGNQGSDFANGQSGTDLCRAEVTVACEL